VASAPRVGRLERAVEIDAAEAVDLDVDKAGRDPGYIEHVALSRRDGSKMAVLDLDLGHFAGEQPRGDFHACSR
jgi:hypothetical protein